jgi:PIN domain nuclease of toxin-antitoxin system
LTILDAYAVLAFLKGEAAANEVEQLITAGGALTAVGVAEVIDHLVRLGGADEEEASLDLAQLGLDDAVAIDGELAGAAGRFRARRYHRTRCPVSLADCVAAEVARSTGRPLATSDPALLDACHHEEIAVSVLPGTDGSRWSPPAPK